MSASQHAVTCLSLTASLFLPHTCCCSPSPVPTPSPMPTPGCASGNATCFCAGKAAGMYADQSSGCSGFYWCVSATQAYYKTCGTGECCPPCLPHRAWVLGASEWNQGSELCMLVPGQMQDVAMHVVDSCRAHVQ